MITFHHYCDLREDSGSKLYHGSNSEQIVGRLRTNERDSGWFGAGFYLTAYPQYAQKWGKFVYQMAVPQGKFAEIRTDNSYNEIEFLGDAQAANQEAGDTEAWVDDERAWSKKFTDSLRRMGYVGVRIHVGQYPDIEVLVFDPSTITVLGKVN